MTVWSELMNRDNRSERGKISRSLLHEIKSDCLTRKPRDPMKRDLMRQLGLPELYKEVQYPSPGNTPDDLDDVDL